MITEEDYKFANDYGRENLFKRLLKERDSALEGKKAAELRAEAYREVALKYVRKMVMAPEDNREIIVDAEALRIMKEKGGQ